jgi:Flp pilus assembly pilin Flp
MVKRYHDKRAQSILEYAMLIIVIATALMVMNTYIQRAITARLRQVHEELNESRR